MKKLIACSLILTMLSSVGSVCFAIEDDNPINNETPVEMEDAFSAAELLERYIEGEFGEFYDSLTEDCQEIRFLVNAVLGRIDRSDCTAEMGGIIFNIMKFIGDSINAVFSHSSDRHETDNVNDLCDFSEEFIEKFGLIYEPNDCSLDAILWGLEHNNLPLWKIAYFLYENRNKGILYRRGDELLSELLETNDDIITQLRLLANFLYEYYKLTEDADCDQDFPFNLGDQDYREIDDHSQIGNLLRDKLANLAQSAENFQNQYTNFLLFLRDNNVQV